MRKRFEYTNLPVREGVELRKPCLNVVLSYQEGRGDPVPTPEISVLVDTGSDLCIFDWALATTLMGFDPSRVGTLTRVGGFAGSQDAYLVPVNLAIPALGLSHSILGCFGKFSMGVSGVLGHRGFLNEFEITFVRGEHFIVADERPAPVVELKPVGP